MQAMINNPLAGADVRVEINQGQGFEPHIEIMQAQPQQSQQSTAAPTNGTNTTSSTSERRCKKQEALFSLGSFG